MNGDIMINLDLYGECVGTMIYGNLVEFWCRSLDGDSTDTRIIPVTFPTEEIAQAVAKAAAFRG
jgi:hypothetical protein